MTLRHQGALFHNIVLLFFGNPIEAKNAESFTANQIYNLTIYSNNMNLYIGLIIINIYSCI